MRKSRYLLPFLAVFSLTTSCNFLRVANGNVFPGEYENKYTQAEDYIADFSNGFPYGFYLRNDRGNGHPFNCSFSNQNAKFENGCMDLYLTKNNDKYIGAELASINAYGYGYYSTFMKPSKCSGVISSFFTYTHYPSWHEIDIEFLGYDTTIVQFNHYTNGKGGHEYFYNLGFDASLDYHEYGFNWTENEIIYYVDGVAVYRTITEIPYHQSRIMMNIWNVHDDKKEWAGKFDDSKLPINSSYKWIGYQAEIA